MRSDTVSGAGAQALIASLQKQIDEVLRPLLKGETRVALLDFPNHANVGDSAIWLGEVAGLRALGVAPLCYTCDYDTYCAPELRERIGDGIILLHGGGNLGDLWPEHQDFREKVIRDFPGQRIIQLPQSICFRDPENLARSRELFNHHAGLTLLLRDRRSWEFAREHFAAPAFLCPDMAFCLDTLVRPFPADGEIVWLARTDQESSTPDAACQGAGIRRVDWLEEPVTELMELNWLLSSRLNEDRDGRNWLRDAVSLTYDPLARERLERGCHLLGTGRAVITDRLHGHILCILLGIEHVILDNSYGKLSSFYDTWTRPCSLGKWCNSAAEAVRCATAWQGESR
ncbi:MAG TPA: polysaccharide pyruvyl transferase family protein [Gemmataceae bacterium]|nr:polysaccharide pyruvyl transferase family protein [Gemmataceae bacterium]